MLHLYLQTYLCLVSFTPLKHLCNYQIYCLFCVFLAIEFLAFLSISFYSGQYIRLQHEKHDDNEHNYTCVELSEQSLFSIASRNFNGYQSIDTKMCDNGEVEEGDLSLWMRLRWWWENERDCGMRCCDQHCILNVRRQEKYKILLQHFGVLFVFVYNWTEHKLFETQNYLNKSIDNTTHSFIKIHDYY